jgi:peptide/nickel transport system permease protein
VTTYIVNRLLQAVPVFFIIGAITFVLMRIPAGDPVTFLAADNPQMTNEMIDSLREDLGLQRPLIVQYLDWQWKAIRGDLGYSYLNGFPVATLIGQRLPKSIELAVVALAVGLPIAMVSGILAAVFRGSWIDNVVTAFVTAGISIPSFWLAIMLIIVFGVNLGWLPSSGYVPLFEDPVQHLKLITLPTITLAVLVAAPAMRFLRANLIEVLEQDYVRTARAKGLAENIVIIRHALKNALIPTVTFIGVQSGHLLAGTVVIEFVFGWTGLGWFTVFAIQSSDFLIVQGTVLVYAALFMGINIAVDIIYAYLDPRIRY